MTNYGTEVRLLAVTHLSSRFEGEMMGILGKFPVVEYPGESLIEYASRLCVDKVGDVGSRPNYVGDRIAQGHDSVLEHASATFYIKASRVLTHELVRHRIASYSQRSQRYVKETEPRYITPPELVGKVIEQDELNRCIASSGFPGFFKAFKHPVDVAATTFHTVLAIRLFDAFMKLSWVVYGLLLKCGLNPEIARYVLPNACETQIITTMNFRELRHFIRLRTSKRALPEMQEVAGKVRDICKTIAPQVFEDV